MHLPPDDELLLRVRVVLRGVVRVHLAPVLQGGAVVGVGRGDGGLGVGLVGIDPLAVAAVEVPVVVRAEESFVAGGDDFIEGGLTLPGLDDGVVGREGEVPGQEGFFPDDGGQAVRTDKPVGVVDEGLEERLDHGRGAAADGGVEGVHFGVNFVTTCVEEGGEWGDAGEEVGEEGGDEVGDVGGVEFQLAGRGFGRVRGPWLFVPRGDEVRIGVRDGSGVSGSVDFEVDLNPSVCSVGLDLLEIRDAPCQI